MNSTQNESELIGRVVNNLIKVSILIAIQSAVGVRLFSAAVQKCPNMFPKWSIQVTIILGLLSILSSGMANYYRTWIGLRAFTPVLYNSFACFGLPIMIAMFEVDTPVGYLNFISPFLLPFLLLTGIIAPWLPRSFISKGLFI